MDENLISKKELLEVAGISYGSLYRWKRKNLIPEEWFIRKSTFTGQETFFPRDDILTRIEKIKNMKEDLSLDDLAGVFSPNLAEITLSKDEVLKRNIVNKASLEFFAGQHGDMEKYTFDILLYAYVLDRMLQSGEINLDEGKILIQTLEDNYKKFEGKNCELVFIRKFGVSTCFIVTSPCDFHFEKGTRIVTRLSLTDCIRELKMKIY